MKRRNPISGPANRRVRTIHDDRPSREEFRRYEKVVTAGGNGPDQDRATFRITIDFFVDREGIPTRTVDGWTVVDPATLVTFYTRGHHGSSECFAVTAARRLLAAGVEVEGHPDLVAVPAGARS
jgi:hypothetical protein